jgi:hypothetical protein
VAGRSRLPSARVEGIAGVFDLMRGVVGERWNRRRQQSCRVERRGEVRRDNLAGGVNRVLNINDRAFLNARQASGGIISISAVDGVGPGDAGEPARVVVIEIDLRPGERVADLREPAAAVVGVIDGERAILNGDAREPSVRIVSRALVDAAADGIGDAAFRVVGEGKIVRRCEPVQRIV